MSYSMALCNVFDTISGNPYSVFVSPTLDQLPPESTAKEAVEIITSLAGTLAIDQSPPSLRTLRLWRAKGWLSKSGRRLNRRNLLEALGILRLCADGYSTGAAAQRCINLDDERLASLILPPEAIDSSTRREYAKVTLDLLARGVIEQHHRVRRGSIVGVVRHGEVGAEATPVALRQAMARLGRLYFEDGLEDRAASVHGLIELCMTPLCRWAPRSIHSLTGCSDLVLVDPYYQVPSEECEAIAEQAPGSRLEDLIERGLHSRLMSTIDRLGSDTDGVYTAVREFIVRHPLATDSELREFRSRPEIPDDAVQFVQSLYVPVHSHHSVDGAINRCAYCSAPIDREGRCFLGGCREDHPATRPDQPVPREDARVVQAEVLKYWVDPARDELRLFDSLREAGIDAILYPHSDRCDVAMADDIGVDVKDYRDPVSLARRLNRDVSGLMSYRKRRIVAIADRRVRANSEYITRLRELLRPGIREEIEVLSVTSSIRELRKMYRWSGNDNAT